jgi:hypothetical protein
MLYVSANQKAVSLNLHRYTEARAMAYGFFWLAQLVISMGRSSGNRLLVLGGALHAESS